MEAFESLPVHLFLGIWERWTRVREDDRLLADWRAGRVCVELYRAAGREKKSRAPWEPRDFFPNLPEEVIEGQEPDEMVAIFKALTKG